MYNVRRSLAMSTAAHSSRAVCCDAVLNTPLIRAAVQCREDASQACCGAVLDPGVLHSQQPCAAQCLTLVLRCSAEHSTNVCLGAMLDPSATLSTYVSAEALYGQLCL